VTAAEILEAVIAEAIKYGPAVVAAVEQVVADVKDKHPELEDAPPTDKVVSIDAAIDAAIAAKEPKGAA
jgi:hypothetical protein